MKIFNKNIIALYFPFLIFLPGAVFAIAFLEDEDVIWQASANEFLKYAEQEKSNFGKNDHPVELSVEGISKALASLRIVEKDRAASDKGQEPVFTVKQVDTLSQKLAEGFRKAKPNQDIIFALEKSISRPLGLKADRLFVAGRAFYKDGKLNIIIGDYDRGHDEGFEQVYDPTHVGIVRYQFDHGRRSKSAKGFSKAIAEVEGVENKQLKGTRRNDWLVIDLRLASEASDFKARMQKTEELESKRKELKELLAGENELKEMLVAQAASPSDPTAAPQPKAKRSFEERLTTLNQLRDKGLITDEEYAMKRKQILDEL